MALNDFSYPSAAELRLVTQELLPKLTITDPIFRHFPITEEDTDILMWEQELFYTGLQGVRGLNGEPGRVKQVGLNRFIAEPGVYGEWLPINERDLTRRRMYGTFGSSIDITDLVLRRQRQLLTRRINRIEQIMWSLAATGTYSVAQTVGGTSYVMATDTYAFQTFSAGVSWGTPATATPLADFRAVQLLSRGYSVSFARDAVAYMNQGTWNKYIANLNAADIYGRRTGGLGTYENVQQVNQLLQGDNLPQIEVYDGNYRADPANAADPGAVQLLVPDNKVVVIGNRTGGEAIGEYRMTRNASNPNLAPGPYMAVVEVNPGKPPRKIEVHDGHNGGPVVFHNKAIVIMSV